MKISSFCYAATMAVTCISMALPVAYAETSSVEALMILNLPDLEPSAFQSTGGTAKASFSPDGIMCCSTGSDTYTSVHLTGIICTGIKVPYAHMALNESATVCGSDVGAATTMCDTLGGAHYEDLKNQAANKVVEPMPDFLKEMGKKAVLNSLKCSSECSYTGTLCPRHKRQQAAAQE